MREAIGGTWLFGLVITFIVFFASFLAISINYAKAFNVKNEVVNIVSKYEGNNGKARKNISNYLKKQGYMVTGTCDSDYSGYDLNGKKTDPGKKSYYCIKPVSYDEYGVTELFNRKYYSVVVFFKVDLPIIGNLTNIKVIGETEAIYFPNDDALIYDDDDDDEDYEGDVDEYPEEYYYDDDEDYEGDVDEYPYEYDDDDEDYQGDVDEYPYEYDDDEDYQGYLEE